MKANNDAEQLSLGMGRRRKRRALPDTSHRAEAKALPFSKELRERIYAALERARADERRRGATASELAEELAEPVLNVRRRLSELHRREARARDTGSRRLNHEGNDEVVWAPVLAPSKPEDSDAPY